MDHSPTPELFAGDMLLHTDRFPTNVLIAQDRAVLVDWAWTSYGAGWIDPALWAVWLIREGHTPRKAERWASQVPAWATATKEGLDAFTAATVSVREEITADDPEPWMTGMLTAAKAWNEYRRMV
ncbi:hypothetical protein OHA61_39320 [Streptomyces sp. NBC_00885]|uniref:hypothetical protein n=1 Tax=Streptomyces sp. NBC_00885 TaxID=2975857 RepID=UPI0038648E6E|nr:hypothetical protein OHA61_39320 [Streptomyces sp. NBC_00885]